MFGSGVVYKLAGSARDDRRMAFELQWPKATFELGLPAARYMDTKLLRTATKTATESYPLIGIPKGSTSPYASARYQLYRL